MEELFKSVRGACSPLTWSRGVELSRGNAVLAERVTENELVLRVSYDGRPVSATVKLWPEDEDWFCDCQGGPGACEHVVAAVIVARRARQEGQELPVATLARGLVTYHFHRDGKAIRLERRIRLGDGETELGGSLAALLSGRVKGPAVNASKEDVTIDSHLGGVPPSKKTLPEDVVRRILTLLFRSDVVFLDGEKKQVGSAAPARRLVVRDSGAGDVRIVSERDPECDEVFSNGAIRRGDVLCPLAVPELTAQEQEIVTRGRLFAANELGDLASRILPVLHKYFPVEVKSQRLPQVGEAMRPRLLFQTQAAGQVLAVLPLLVYGDPPIARVDAGRLTPIGESGVVPERNPAAERSLMNTLQSRLGFSIGRKLEFRGEAATKLIEKLGAFPAKVVGNGLSYFGLKPALVPSVDFDGERPRVEFRLPGGGGTSAMRVLQAWEDGLERVALDDGSGWAPIPVDWLQKHGHRILELLEAKTEDGKLPASSRPELARLLEALNLPCPPELTRLKEQLEEFRGIPVARLPADLNAELRSYQRLGVNWLTFLSSQDLGALLADDMGLGKTLQTLATMKGRTLVVAPTSVVTNWAREAARFRPKLKVAIYHGGDRRLDSDADLTITTYAILRLDVEKLSAVAWDRVVLDEAQNIKNPESQVAQAAFRLKARARVALTGTPIENRLEDLWSLFHFLNRGLLGGRSEFQERYSWNALQRDPSRAGLLRSKIKPFLLRRLKGEVARELPPRTDVTLYCELEPSEREAYESVRAATRQEVLDLLGTQANVLAALECLLRLRQASCHPGLLPGYQAEDSSKLRLLRDKLEEALSEGHKALVFSQWTSLLDLIEPLLEKSGIAFCRIDGTTRDRGAVVEKFQSSDGPPVLLMTLKAGGVGLNLTAADHVFLVDPWWNPAAEDQAADRAHRIGQDRPVFVHRLVARDTVEEKILALQERKRAAAAMALEGAAGAVGLTRDDLLALLA